MRAAHRPVSRSPTRGRTESERRLRFAKHPDVAFTNNRAERDLRMSKVKQKVSGCFRTRKYAEAYCRISSYLQSMANQGYNPLVAIQIALAGRAVDNLPAPRSLRIVVCDRFRERLSDRRGGTGNGSPARGGNGSPARGESGDERPPSAFPPDTGNALSATLRGSVGVGVFTPHLPPRPLQPPFSPRAETNLRCRKVAGIVHASSQSHEHSLNRFWSTMVPFALVAQY